MENLDALYGKKREALVKALAASRDAKEAEGALAQFWETLRADYVRQAQNEQEQEGALLLFAAMAQGTQALGAMTQAQVQKTYLPSVQLPGGEGAWGSKVRKYGASGLCVLASALCILSGQTIAALCTLAAAALTGYAALRGQGTKMQEPQLLVTPLPDIDALMERVDRAVQALDALLTRRREGLARHQKALPWTQAQLEGVQMLWEAYEDRDGTYALQAVPQLLSELQGQQVTLRLYGEGVDESFDLLPGLEDGRTVRPALYRGDTLLARGQATHATKQESR